MIHMWAKFPLNPFEYFCLRMCIALLFASSVFSILVVCLRTQNFCYANDVFWYHCLADMELYSQMLTKVTCAYDRKLLTLMCVPYLVLMHSWGSDLDFRCFGNVEQQVCLLFLLKTSLLTKNLMFTQISTHAESPEDIPLSLKELN